MFFHAMKYTFLCLIRDKSQVLWCFAFPLILGTMFYFAFGGLSSDEAFSAIPVAVVTEASDTSGTLAAGSVSGSIPDSAWSVRTMLDALSEPGEDQFLEITYASDTDALALLEQKEIYGIIRVNMPDISAYMNSTDSMPDMPAPLALTISEEMDSDPLYQSILSAFITQFNIDYDAILDIAMTAPEKLPTVLEAMTMETDYIDEVSLGSGSLDESLTYFFNLIAMTCLYGAMAGNDITIKNQANLSPLGARRNISPVHRLVSILGGLSAALVFEFITILVSLLYFSCVLNIDFGNQLGYIALASLCGCLAGFCLGFFVGSIGRFNKNTKFGILMASIMLSCFLSGLMVGNMRALVESFCPFINRINPAAIISDAFYALAVYPSHERFFFNIASMLVLAVLFCLGGFAMVRRKKYASL